MKRTAWLLLAAGLGCRGLPEPSPEMLARVREIPAPEGPYVRLRAEIDIDSEWLAGHFEGVIVARTGPEPVVRAQFFPDLGGKAFDLVARPDRITGNLPPLDETTDEPMPLEGRPHPLHFIGLTLMEHFAPSTEDRILGVREDGWILLQPIIEGSRVMIRLGPGNRIVRRRYEWGYGISWEEEPGPEGSTIRAKGLRLRVKIHETKRRDRVPDAVFRLPE